MKIQTFTSADLELFTPICQAAFDSDSQLHLGENGGPSGYDDGSYLKRHFLSPENQNFAIFEDNKPIAAVCIHVSTECNELESFFVACDLENKGLGSTIWHWLEKQFPAKHWCVSTPSYSTRNHYFYTKKCGFKHIEDCENISYFEKENL